MMKFGRALFAAIYNFRYLISLFFLIVTITTLLLAQESQYTYRRRGNNNYKEGVCRRQRIAGEYITLIGFSVVFDNYSNPLPNDEEIKGDSLYLEFQLSDSSISTDSVAFAIRAVAEDYLLSDVDQIFHLGHNCFAWDPTIVEQLEIPFKSLLSLVHSESVNNQIYPSIVHYSLLNRPMKINAYRFFLVPTNNGVLQYSLYYGDSLAQSGQRDAVAEQLVLIETSANSLPSGHYALQVIYSFESRGINNNTSTIYRFNHEEYFGDVENH